MVSTLVSNRKFLMGRLYIYMYIYNLPIKTSYTYIHMCMCTWCVYMNSKIFQIVQKKIHPTFLLPQHSIFSCLFGLVYMFTFFKHV